eukprot:TRINITY_DN11251_c0_g1_i3.p1 TRINITY_DN11251_c0_g1~~TRINITY_DN11251_c0_g1_i3.p1  ORF type:complete len:165 (-),score=42.78 TRINITY_DN11251_c0_g1_i3:294-788(-)
MYYCARSQVRDDDGDEDDGKDEALCPVDYQDGLLRDDEVYATLVGPLQEGVLLTCVLDCCHSGTIMDLPFQFEASDENTAAFESGETSGMTQNPNFDFGKLLEIAKKHPLLAGAAGIALGCVAVFKGKKQATTLAGGLMDVATADDKMSAFMRQSQNLFSVFRS